MANPTTNFGWVMPTATDLVTDLPADFAVFGQGVDTSMQYLLGGTTGQILSKTSGTNMAFTWIANDQGDITGVTAGNGISVTDPTGPVPTVAINTAVTADLTTAQTLTNKTLTSPALTTPTISTLTTNGDLLYGTGSGALARKAIGTTGQVLTVAAGIPSWASSGGMTLLSTTTLSGASTTVSSIDQTYQSLYVRVFGVKNNTADGVFTIKVNAVSSSWCYTGVKGTTAAGAALTNATFTDLVAPTNANRTDGSPVYLLQLDNYSSSTTGVEKIFSFIAGYTDTSGQFTVTQLGGVCTPSAAITALVFSNTGGTFSAGTVQVYGVK